MSEEIGFAVPRSTSRTPRARRERTRVFVQRLYDLVHAGLWAFGAALLLWLIFHAPALSEWRAQIEAQRALEIADENSAYCTKWGMPAGTHAHTLCTLDLNEVRAKHERRMMEQTDGFM